MDEPKLSNNPAVDKLLAAVGYVLAGVLIAVCWFWRDDERE
jgi:hypothetical protein